MAHQRTVAAFATESGQTAGKSGGHAQVVERLCQNSSETLVRFLIYLRMSFSVFIGDVFAVDTCTHSTISWAWDVHQNIVQCSNENNRSLRVPGRQRPFGRISDTTAASFPASSLTGAHHCVATACRAAGRLTPNRYSGSSSARCRGIR
jgi:hypothetical protein